VKYCVLLGFRTCDDAKLLENTIPKLSLPAGRVFGAHRREKIRTSQLINRVTKQCFLVWASPPPFRPPLSASGES
jgi:hypothetical protein